MKLDNKVFYSHGDKLNYGVLFVNLGTPKSASVRDVRIYLREFLSDSRVIELPKIFWWFILNFIILIFRPKKSAKLYSKIWSKNGSPLLVNSQSLVNKVRDGIKKKYGISINTLLAMNYGEPSMKDAIMSLRKNNTNSLLVIPLFPQYSSATTGSVFDKMSDLFKKFRYLPSVSFISSYHDNKNYIAACSNLLKNHWKRNQKGEILVFSFHGLPSDSLDKGDPYHCFCQKTARLISENLSLDETKYIVTFQSRFGPKEWLKPYTDNTVEELAQRGIKSIDVFCPGFLSDCLETLEEINIQLRQTFKENGGEIFNYIDCLNDKKESVEFILDMIDSNIQDYISQNNDENIKTKMLYNKK